MNRISITIRSQHDRDRVAELAKTLAVGMRVTVKQERRSDAQNSKFWAMLGEVSDQVIWHGDKLSPEDWKYLFLDAYKREMRMVRSLEGSGWIPLGRSSSDLSVSEMADVITLIEMFGANHGVKFHEPETEAKASTSAVDRPDGGMLHGPTAGDGQNVAAVGCEPATATNSSSPEPSPQVNAPAANTPPPSEAAGATNSNSSDGTKIKADLADAPAVGSPRHASPAAGASNFEEASLLSDDWRDVIMQNLCGIRDKPASLNTREADARQMIGGKPNAVQDAWIRDAKDLVKRRNEGKISPDMFAILRQELLTCIRLPNGEELA